MNKYLLIIFMSVLLVILLVAGVDTEPTEVTTTTTELTTIEQTTVTETTTTEVELTTVRFEDIVELTELGTFKLTAYCPCTKCCGKSDGITASGTKATAGRTVAVDPSKIPYGTELMIYGDTYIAEDCGGAVKGNVIDIYFDSHEEANNFGVQYAKVFKVR